MNEQQLASKIGNPQIKCDPRLKRMNTRTTY